MININDTIILAGTQYTVTNLFDGDGDDTTDPELATALVAQSEDGTWLSIAIDDLQPVTRH